MKNTIYVVLFLLAGCLVANSQSAIDVAESTVKISASGEETFYYGFAEGDKLIFNFQEVNGKELMELEISAVNSSTLFADYKTKKVENKVLSIPQTGIYKFRFANGKLFGGRVCKFRIQRLPESDQSRKFNSTVYKRVVYDTSYYEVQERYISRIDTVATEIVNQTAKVHSSTNANGNKTVTNFNLPENTISWSYYIGVDQAGQQIFETATKQFVSNSTPLVSKLIGSGPLVAVALGLPSYLSQLQAGEDIDYFLVPGESSNLFNSGQAFRYFKKGKVINDFAKMENIQGNLAFCFSNDNALQGVMVVVKVVAIQVNVVWDSRSVKKMRVNSQEELYLKN